MRLRIPLALAAAIAPALFFTAPAQASTLGVDWSHRAHHWANVRVEDHTGVLWPVRASTRSWGSGYRYGACTGYRCVHVYEGDYGPTGWDADTSYTQSGGHFTSMSIRLNRYYGEHYTYSQRLDVVKHELGHGLGLGHDHYHDVMHPSLTGYPQISAYERSELRRLYLR